MADLELFVIVTTKIIFPIKQKTSAKRLLRCVPNIFRSYFICKNVYEYENLRSCLFKLISFRKFSEN